MEVEYKYSVDKCLYNKNCPLLDTEDCNCNCLRYLEMFYLLHNSRIPVNRHRIHGLKPDDCDKESFRKLKDIKLNIEEFVAQGKNLYLYSTTCGNGKTTWAIKLMQSYFDKIWFGNRYSTRALFIHVPMFMVKLRENISNKSESFMQLLDDLTEVDLVVWDDIAACNLKEYDYMNLVGYIDNRLLSGKSNIFTGNLGEEKIMQVLGERLASRVWRNSRRIELAGFDRRGE